MKRSEGLRFCRRCGKKLKLVKVKALDRGYDGLTGEKVGDSIYFSALKKVIPVSELEGELKCFSFSCRILHYLSFEAHPHYYVYQGEVLSLSGSSWD